MNAEYVRAMPLAELLPMVRVELESAGLWSPLYEKSEREVGIGGGFSAYPYQQRTRDWLEHTVELIRQRFMTLKDFIRQGRAYFSDEFEFEEAAVAKNLKKDAALRELLPELAARLETVEPWVVDKIEQALRAFADERGVKAGLLINASRTALTGQAVGPSMFDVFHVIGRARSAERLRSAARLV
jgi:glutamyl-tRNA synthetase